MSRYHVLVPALVVALFWSVESYPLMAQPAPPYCGAGYGNGVMGFLTQEQRMMHFAEVQKAVAELSFNDMRSYRSALRDKVMAMSAAERKTFADDLAVKWNALSPEQKATLQQEFTAYRGHGRWGGGRGMRQGRSMGGCWW